MCLKHFPAEKSVDSDGVNTGKFQIPIGSIVIGFLSKRGFVVKLLFCLIVSLFYPVYLNGQQFCADVLIDVLCMCVRLWVALR